MQRLLSIYLIIASILCAQASSPTTKQTIKTIRDLGSGGARSIPTLASYLTNEDRDVRLEAVRAIVRIDTMRSLDPLLTATHDSDSEIQTRAIEGIVNAYVPGYVAQGVGGYFVKGARQVKSIFSERNDTVVDADVKVRPDIAPALSEKIEGSGDADVRSTAALAAGILRDGDTVPALEKGLRSKNSDLIFECLIALQKIGDTSAGPSVTFLARDLDERIQATALETIGILHSTTSADDVRYAFKNARNLHIQRTALETLAMLALVPDRALFQQNADQNDTQLRMSSLEGLGRLKDPDDYKKMQTAFEDPYADWRVHSAAAFGMVMEGNNSAEDLSPLRVLVEGFSLKPRTSTAAAYLSEAARFRDTRSGLSKILPDEVKERKIGILTALGTVNAPDSIQILQQYSSDSDRDVANTARKSIRIAQTRKPS